MSDPGYSLGPGSQVPGSGSSTARRFPLSGLGSPDTADRSIGIVLFRNSVVLEVVVSSHSHLLPKLDDDPPSAEASSALEDMGISALPPGGMVLKCPVMFLPRRCFRGGGLLATPSGGSVNRFPDSDIQDVVSISDNWLGCEW